MNILKQFVAGLGRQNAPFGFAPNDPNADYQAGLGYIGDIGANLMANNQPGVNPWANLGTSLQQAKQSSEQRSVDKYKAEVMQDEIAIKRQEQERQQQLGSQWSTFVKNNADKFGEYAGIAPFLDPGEGLKLLSGMRPDWRPATQEERVSLGVGADVPLVITAEGPKVLGNGGGTVINMPPGEKAYDTAAGKGLWDTMQGIQTGRGEAGAAIASYDAMEQSLNQPGVYTGAGAPTVKVLQQLGSALGITDPEAIANIEKFEAAANAAIKAEVGSLGAGVSEGDRRFVENAGPGLTRTPAGNRLIISMKRRLAERKIQVADFADRYAADHGGRLDSGFFAALAKWSASNPLFSSDEQKAISAAGMQGRSAKPAAASAVQGGKGDLQTADPSTMSDEDLLNALGGGF